MKRKYKYYPKDFPELGVEAKHYNIFFDVYEKYTNVESKLRFKTKKKMKKVLLDARKIKVKEVKCKGKEIFWKHDKKKNKLVVEFKKPLRKGEEIVLETKNTCYPSWNDLEGLYYDFTAKGFPQKQITQCQQWGFQKLVPCFDYMNAKAFYKTKIVADSRYSHIISNGNLVSKKRKGKRMEVVYSNEKTPMPPYLFFLGVGNWKEFNREFEYPNGHKFNLQLLTLQNASKPNAEKALEILAYGIQWINVFTGKEKHKNLDRKREIFDLCFKRDALKKKKKRKDVEKARAQLKKLCKGMEFGYEYSGKTYREIAMQNSNFGGMENVGNTTVTANRMLPRKELSDHVFAYLMDVKTHEFYHNLNGSEVTCWSPFDFWLNEAITNHITQNEFLEFASGKGFGRLENVSRIVSRGGTFDEDTGALGHALIPEGFNNPDELVDSVTYSKGPEVIRMIELLLGEKKFAKALSYYHKKFSHKNAQAKDFVEAMEKSSGMRLKRFANVWLKQTGFPKLRIKTKYDSKKKKIEITLKQSGFKKGMHWEFPFKYAIFNKRGEKVFEAQETIKSIEKKIVIKNMETPGFFSFNRGFSFYGKVMHNASEEELTMQVEKDDDVVARHLAFYTLVEKERVRLLENKKAQPKEKIVDLYFKLLSDEETTKNLGTLLLAVPGGVEDEYKTHYYEELYELSKKTRKRIAKKYEKQLLKIYRKRSKRKFSGPFVEKTFSEIKNRSVKNSCLGILSELDTPKIRKLILKQFKQSKNHTDKLVAFSLYLDSKAKNKKQILKEFEEEAKKSLVVWEQFLSLIARSDAENVLELVKKIKSSEHYNITQANDQRALLCVFAYNKRKSLLDVKGRKFLEKTMKELASINEYNTNYVLGTFERLNFMQEKYLPELVKMLVNVLKSLDAKKTPSVYNNIKMVLNKSPRAVKMFEKKYGKLRI